MLPPHLDWVPPTYTSTSLPDQPALVVDEGQSVAGINNVCDGALVVVRGDHSAETIIVKRPMTLKGEDGATVKAIVIQAPCVVTGFSVTGSQGGIFAQGITGTDQYPFIIEGNHCYRNVYGLWLYYCNNVVLKNNFLESNSQIELYIEHLDHGDITGNNLGEAIYKPGGGSVDVDGAAFRYLTNCVFENNYIGEHYYGTRWYTCSDCVIRNNVYRCSGSNLRLGRYYDTSYYGQCTDFQVIGNDILGGIDGIWAQACVKCAFYDNVIKTKYPLPSGYGVGGVAANNTLVTYIST